MLAPLTAIGRCRARLWAWRQARFSPYAYLGLHLILGALCLVGITWLFAASAEAIARVTPLSSLDVTATAWVRARATARVTMNMRCITALGDPRVVSFLALALGLALGRRRQWDWLLALLLTVLGGMAENPGLKAVFARTRPAFSAALGTLSRYSFPSGHTMAATLLYGFLAAYVVRRVPAGPGRGLVVLGASLTICLVGVSRIYLGAHYLGDVLGAMMEGMAWLGLCLTGLASVRRRSRPLPCDSAGGGV